MFGLLCPGVFDQRWWPARTLWRAASICATTAAAQAVRARFSGNTDSIQ
jgi:hypothetical protein